MRPFRLLVVAVVSVVALLLAILGLAYAADYPVGATVQERCTPLNGYAVPIRTDLFAIEHTVTGIPPQQCSLVGPGNYVEYRLRSGRVSMYETQGGACIFDSEHGVGGCAA